jgi:hypothetical protein
MQLGVVSIEFCLAYNLFIFALISSYIDEYSLLTLSHTLDNKIKGIRVQI